jgi:hypothetical protein
VLSWIQLLLCEGLNSHVLDESTLSSVYQLGGFPSACATGLQTLYSLMYLTIVLQMLWRSVMTLSHGGGGDGGITR